QVAQNHRLVCTTTIDPQRYDNLGLDSFTAIESGHTTELGGVNLVLKDTSIFNPNVFLDSTVQHFTSSPRYIPTASADTNGNAILDPGEDRNNNGKLDDRPFRSPSDVEVQVLPDGSTLPLPYYYPYTSPRPIASDRDSTLNLNTQVTTGPSPQTYDQTVGRNTLREDLTIFVPDWKGQHDLKIGAVAEHETFNQSTDLRPIRLATTTKFAPARVGILLPAETHVENSGDSTTMGLYVQDSWKPVPNLTIGLGLRFDRE